MDSPLLQSAPANSGDLLKELQRMARKRYQKGSVKLRNGNWVCRWREDIIKDGVIVRLPRKMTLSKADYPTKKLAQRELDKKLLDINSPSYRPRPVCTFAAFADRWQKEIMIHHRPSSRASEKSHIKVHLVPALGEHEMKDIGCYEVQRLVSGIKGSGKTAKNVVATLREMHNSAKAWAFTSLDWFDGLVLPEWDRPESRCFTEDEMRQIVNGADGMYQLFYWVVSETGMRLGECCALRPCDFNLDARVVIVRYSAWHGKVTRTKSKRPRVCEISPNLSDYLKMYFEGKDAQAYVFSTKSGGPWFGDDVVRDHLKPLLKELGIPHGGMHAFRHGNLSIMDQAGVPLKVRQNRVGHVSDSDLTLNVYTHANNRDGHAIAELMGEKFAPVTRMVQ